ncbi:MAG: erythromycin esterase family protein [Mycobacteriaceae bacterium]
MSRRSSSNLPFGRTPQAANVLRSTRLERAIGVSYRPQTERESHFFLARVADQFRRDHPCHGDTRGRALSALPSGNEEAPETYLFAV